MSAPVPEVDPGLVEVLAGHEIGRWSDWTYSCLGCKGRYEDAVESDVSTFDRAEHNRLTKPGWTRADADAHLARVVQGYVEGRVAAALEDAARRLAAFDCLSDQVPRHVDVPDDYETGMHDAARIVRSDARRSPQTASTPDDGPGGVRGGDRE